MSLDACHDPAWRLLIETYEQIGDLSAAAVARADHRRVWDDLGVVLPRSEEMSAHHLELHRLGTGAAGCLSGSSTSAW